MQRNQIPNNHTRTQTVTNTSNQSHIDRLETNIAEVRFQNELNNIDFRRNQLQNELNTTTPANTANVNPNSNTTLNTTPSTTSNTTTTTYSRPVVNNDPNVDGNATIQQVVEQIPVNDPQNIIPRDAMAQQNLNEMAQNMHILQEQGVRIETNIQNAEIVRRGATQFITEINTLINSYIPYGSWIFWSTLTVGGSFILYNINPIRFSLWAIRRNMAQNFHLIPQQVPRSVANIFDPRYLPDVINNATPDQVSSTITSNFYQDIFRNPAYYAPFAIIFTFIRRFRG